VSPLIAQTIDDTYYGGDRDHKNNPRAFIATIDGKGARRIRLRTMPVDPPAAMQALASLLDDAIRSDPGAWHLWAEWTRFLPSREAGGKARVR
jgi:hypothetical protein